MRKRGHGVSLVFNAVILAERVDGKIDDGVRADLGASRLNGGYLTASGPCSQSSCQ